MKHGLLKLIKKQRTTYIDGIYGINLQAYFRKILGSVHFSERVATWLVPFAVLQIPKINISQLKWKLFS